MFAIVNNLMISNYSRKPATKKRKLNELMDKASDVLEEAAKASKAHYKFLLTMAEKNDLTLSDSD